MREKQVRSKVSRKRRVRTTDKHRYIHGIPTFWTATSPWATSRRGLAVRHHVHPHRRGSCLYLRWGDGPGEPLDPLDGTCRNTCGQNWIKDALGMATMHATPAETHPPRLTGALVLLPGVPGRAGALGDGGEHEPRGRLLYAAMESFWATLKERAAGGEGLRHTREEARSRDLQVHRGLLQHAKGSTHPLGYVSPEAFEAGRR